MSRIKIIGGIVVLVVTLGVIITSGRAPVTNVGQENTPALDKSNIIVFDQQKAALHELQQRELKAAVQAYFDRAIAKGDIVGAGVSIVRGDSIVISEGFGKRNIKTNEAVDGETIFRLGSLSKGFAGILAANLISEGKLHSEDKVSDYIPEFQLGDRDNTAKITLANILSHTAGAPYHSYTNLVEAGVSLKDIASRFKEVQPISIPGTLYSYQNALFALAGEVMSKVTGQEITTSLENRFFNPLEMCSTTMDHESLKDAENVASPHTKWRNSWRPKKLNDHYYNAVAAGGISASAMDMAKWMRFILGHNPEIMDKSAIKKAFNPFIEIKGRSKYYQRWPGHVSSHYGYGWRIHKYVEGTAGMEKTIWHHGGSVNNYRNEIAVYPEADLGICILLNSQSKIAKNVVPDVYNIIQEVYREGTTSAIASNNFTD